MLATEAIVAGAPSWAIEKVQYGELFNAIDFVSMRSQMELAADSKTFHPVLLKCPQ
jgi:hypothetical protein